MLERCDSAYRPRVQSLADMRPIDDTTSRALSLQACPAAFPLLTVLLFPGALAPSRCCSSVRNGPFSRPGCQSTAGFRSLQDAATRTRLGMGKGTCIKRAASKVCGSVVLLLQGLPYETVNCGPPKPPCNDERVATLADLDCSDGPPDPHLGLRMLLIPCSHDARTGTPLACSNEPLVMSPPCNAYQPRSLWSFPWGLLMAC